MLIGHLDHFEHLDQFDDDTCAPWLMLGAQFAMLFARWIHGWGRLMGLAPTYCCEWIHETVLRHILLYHTWPFERCCVTYNRGCIITYHRGVTMMYVTTRSNNTLLSDRELTSVACNPQLQPRSHYDILFSLSLLRHYTYLMQCLWPQMTKMFNNGMIMLTTCTFSTCSILFYCYCETFYSACKLNILEMS